MVSIRRSHISLLRLLRVVYGWPQSPPAETDHLTGLEGNAVKLRFSFIGSRFSYIIGESPQNLSILTVVVVLLWGGFAN
jgi:hypothetical protein